MTCCQSAHCSFVHCGCNSDSIHQGWFPAIFDLGPFIVLSRGVVPQRRPQRRGALDEPVVHSDQHRGTRRGCSHRAAAGGDTHIPVEPETHVLTVPKVANEVASSTYCSIWIIVLLMNTLRHYGVALNASDTC